MVNQLINRSDEPKQEKQVGTSGSPHAVRAFPY
jgi:hypothetical protein